jgi:hypothetical protein
MIGGRPARFAPLTRVPFATGMGMGMETEFEVIKKNLFPASHAAIGDWDKFPWHRNRHGRIDTDKPHSSQALAIDVFGTIKASPERDRVLSALARQCGLPGDGPWELKLEWIDPENRLKEPTPTQADAIAFGRLGLLLFEGKFTEHAGSCSQPNVIAKGDHHGMRQCTGNYELQTNPVNKVDSRCALTGKGVLYWKAIQTIYGLDPEQDHLPCPFRGEAYQWMRSVVLAGTLASARGQLGTVVAAYAGGDQFPTAMQVQSGHLGLPSAPASGKRLVIPMSYQAIVELAQGVSEHPSDWTALGAWVRNKISSVQLPKGNA